MGKHQKNNGATKTPMTSSQKRAAVKVICAWAMVLEVMALVFGLWAVCFVSTAFAIILAALAVCFGMFRTGYLWRDLKF